MCETVASYMLQPRGLHMVTHGAISEHNNNPWTTLYMSPNLKIGKVIAHDLPLIN